MQKRLHFTKIRRNSQFLRHITKACAGGVNFHKNLTKFSIYVAFQYNSNLVVISHKDLTEFSIFEAHHHNLCWRSENLIKFSIYEAVPCISNQAIFFHKNLTEFSIFEARRNKTRHSREVKFWNDMLLQFMKEQNTLRVLQMW